MERHALERDRLALVIDEEIHVMPRRPQRLRQHAHRNRRAPRLVKWLGGENEDPHGNSWPTDAPEMFEEGMLPSFGAGEIGVRFYTDAERRFPTPPRLKPVPDKKGSLGAHSDERGIWTLELYGCQ